MEPHDHALPAAALRHHCDASQLGFTSTAELTDLDGVIGQERALGALEFATGMRSSGYHLYAMGPAGTGKATTIRRHLERQAAHEPVPDDWLYAHDFANEDKPRALGVAAGCGRQLRNDMDAFVDELKTDVPNAFESKEYTQEQQRIEQEFEQRGQAIINRLQQEAEQRGFTLLQGPQGIALTPVKDGRPLRSEEIAELPEAERNAIQARQNELEPQTRETMRQVQQLQKEGRERIRELDQRTVALAVDHRLEALKEKYHDFAAVLAFLDQVRGSIINNVQSLKQLGQSGQQTQAQGEQGPHFDQYRVNLVVDHGEDAGAPVVRETNPTVPNLIGRIEHQVQSGALVTHFRLIKAGALQRANGGYLMLDVLELFTRPLAWSFLKRAVKNREVTIEGMEEHIGALTTRTLQPEAIPLDVKIILIGDPMIYYLLINADPDFRELFKVKADFATQIDWNAETVNQYGRFIARVCREEGLPSFQAEGVAKVVEQAAREVAHQHKLMTRFGDVVDLLRQAAYWAKQHAHTEVTGADVTQALEARIERANRLETQLHEWIEEGSLIIATTGWVTSQINGLAVMSLGDYAFGRPSRITARTFVGTSGLTSIEREAKLGGPLHNKGSMILVGYLGGQYARDVPLALSATLTFEQTYEGVEGDSASCAELFTLLSSLAELPLRQDLAVTGSVDQRGEIQPIGGVNEKIEGFYEVCRLKGLTGTQGVLIPQANARHLMLREPVVEAVSRGDFHVYTISNVDEGIALLTGYPAGERQADGHFPDGTVNAAVQQRMATLAQRAKAFGGGSKEG